MELNEIKTGNRLIAEFMGYIYCESDVLVDYSDCGGIYDKVDVYSKTPIQVNCYEGDGKYFKELPNPDFGNENNPRWNNTIEKLSWATLNEYKTDLKYDTSWDELMPVVEKIGDVRIRPTQWFTVEITNGYTRIHGTGEKIMYNASVEKSMIRATWLAVIKFIEWYGENKNEKK